MIYDMRFTRDGLGGCTNAIASLSLSMSVTVQKSRPAISIDAGAVKVRILAEKIKPD